MDTLTKNLQKLIALSLVMALYAFIPQNAHAQTTWQATYWRNPTLSGTPALSRQELAIDHDWGFNAPNTSVDNDSFSARWVHTEELAEGTYRFTASADDGIRVWINDIQIMDEWNLSGARTVVEEIYLPAGTYETRVEYVERTGIANVQFERTQLQPGESSESTPLTPADDVVSSAEAGSDTRDDPTETDSNNVDFADSSSTDGTNGDLDSDQLFWYGEYFDNTDLNGTPALIRQENNIDFRWGFGSPAENIIGDDTFSARWTRTLDVPAGRYRFTVTADDGIRLFINDQLIIDRWREQSVATYRAEVDLNDTPASVRLEYFEVSGKATATFSYAEIVSEPEIAIPIISIPVESGEWRAEYFNNTSLSGEPSVVRTDDEINFDWGVSSPIPGEIDADRFSVRWTRQLEVAPGRYRFTSVVDDGVRLRVNGRVIINEFVVRSATQYVADIDLPTGRPAIEMEYFDNTERAVARLRWERIGALTSTNIVEVASLPSDEPLAVVTSASVLNVRRGPGVGFARIDRLVSSQQIQMIGRNRSSSWIQISLSDGRTGWVSARFIDSNYELSQLRETG